MGESEKRIQLGESGAIQTLSEEGKQSLGVLKIKSTDTCRSFMVTKQHKIQKIRCQFGDGLLYGHLLIMSYCAHGKLDQ